MTEGGEKGAEQTLLRGAIVGVKNEDWDIYGPGGKRDEAEINEFLLRSSSERSREQQVYEPLVVRCSEVQHASLGTLQRSNGYGDKRSFVLCRLVCSRQYALCVVWRPRIDDTNMATSPG